MSAVLGYLQSEKLQPKKINFVVPVSASRVDLLIAGPGGPVLYRSSFDCRDSCHDGAATAPHVVNGGRITRHDGGRGRQNQQQAHAADYDIQMT